MPIRIRCSCGSRFQAKDEHAGRRAKCPSCGAAIDIPEPILEPTPEPAAPLTFAAISAEVGKVVSPDAYLAMNLHVKDDGSGYLSLFASEPGSRRKGEFLILGRRQFDELKAIVAKADQAVASLTARGQMRRMIEG